LRLAPTRAAVGDLSASLVAVFVLFWPVWPSYWAQMVQVDLLMANLAPKVVKMAVDGCGGLSYQLH